MKRILFLILILTFGYQAVYAGCGWDCQRAIEGSIFGTGLTTNTIPKATGATTLGDSNITDNGTAIGITQDLDWDSSASTEEISIDSTFAIDGGAVDYDQITMTSTITDSTAHNLTGYMISLNRANVIDAGGADQMGAIEIVWNDGPNVDGDHHLLDIEDRRTGTECNEVTESAIHIDSDGTYGAYFEDGVVFFASAANPQFQGMPHSLGGIDIDTNTTSELVTLDQTLAINGSAVDIDAAKFTTAITDSTAHNLTGSILHLQGNNTVDAGGTDTLAMLELSDLSGGTDRYAQFRFDEANGGLELWQSTDGSTWTHTHTFELAGTVTDEVP